MKNKSNPSAWLTLLWDPQYRGSAEADQSHSTAHPTSTKECVGNKMPILPLTFCSSSSLFTQYKVQITKISSILYTILGKHGFAQATPLAWNVCFPHPQCLLGNLNFFKAKQAWHCQVDSQPPFPSSSWRASSSDSDMYPSPTGPMSLRESWLQRWPWMMIITGQETQAKTIEGWYLSVWSWEYAIQAKLAERKLAGRLLRRQFLTLKRWQLNQTVPLFLWIL